MELLQFLQYFVLDDCDNWLNQLTTAVRPCVGMGRLVVRAATHTF
jgi:hypothetical protein